MIPDCKTFIVKILYPTHSCIRADCTENPNANTEWVAQKLNELLQADPNMSYELMQGEIKNKWGVEVPMWKLYRARGLGRPSMEGSHEESYKQLKKYIAHLWEINPDTFVKMEFQPRNCLDEPVVFKNLFICFDAVKKGFLEGCRPIIGVESGLKVDDVE